MLNALFPRILNDIFMPVLRPYNLHRNDAFQRQSVNSFRYGTKYISFIAPKI